MGSMNKKRLLKMTLEVYQNPALGVKKICNCKITLQFRTHFAFVHAAVYDEILMSAEQSVSVAGVGFFSAGFKSLDDASAFPAGSVRENERLLRPHF
jgi:hypothetical protein